MVESSIVNVVATAALGQKIDLVELGKFREVRFNSNVYRGRVAYFKTPTMRGKVSIFFSGKMISVGTRSEEEAFSELERAKEFLVEKGFVKQIKLEYRIQNIVVSADFKEKMDLEQLSSRLNVIYEPEQFPGIILRIEKPYEITVLLFASGKVVLAGLKGSEQIEPSLLGISRLIK